MSTKDTQKLIQNSTRLSAPHFYSFCSTLVTLYHIYLSFSVTDFIVRGKYLNFTENQSHDFDFKLDK